MIQSKEVIIADVTQKGSGKDATSPIRRITEVYSKEGELIAVNDSLGNYSIEDLILFAKFYQTNAGMSIEEILKLWR